MLVFAATVAVASLVGSSALTQPPLAASADELPPPEGELAPQTVVPGPTEPPADEVVVPPEAEQPTMPVYSVESFAAQAAELPEGLTAAVERDLGETPEGYLARTTAAVQAGAVVDGLVGSGVEVLGSRLEGTELVVNVADEAQAASVTEVGAIAEVGAPEVPDYSGVRLEALADLVGGQGFQFAAAGEVYVCSVGFNGRYKPYPQQQFITSGHCIEPDRDTGTYYFESKQSRAGAAPSRGAIIGAPIESLFRFGSGADVGVVATGAAWNLQPKISTWGGGAGVFTDGTPVTITDATPGIVGSPVCKSGRTTGWSCGSILVVNESYPVYNHEGTPQYVNLTLTDVCMLPGDSGAGAVIGSAAFGIGSAGSFQNTCDTRGQPNAISAFFPLLTTNGSKSVSSTIPDWELSVALRQPTVVRPSFVGDAIRGTLPGAGPRHRVAVTIDKNSYLVTPNAKGEWSLPIPAALQSGTHSFTAAARWGDFSFSAAVSDSYRLLPKPAVDRVSGDDRYAVALQISKRTFPSTAPVVYLATGQNYPDALSAGPAAVKQGGPLLLTPTDQLPAAVAAEIGRLKPATIVVVGGPASVSAAVYSQLSTLAKKVVRLQGDDRYAASRAVAEYAFGTSAAAYVATGANFPDALSTGSAAGSRGVPITLVNGSAAGIDTPTQRLFASLKTTQITISGGPNSVSPGVESALKGIATVNRLSGADRFQASQSINRSAFSSSGTVYLATGYNYPDALAGGVLAAKGKAPLYIVPGDCVPRGVISDIGALKATKVVLLGGPNSLNASVGSLSACSW